MSTAAPSASRPLTVALIGNPNTGKSTLFNALAGSNALVGNYPGVTVEKKIGRTRWGEQAVALVDLPGTYSLSPRSLDEMVSVDVLLGRQPDVGRPDAVICILDASNLERNLYLVSQVLDVGLPMVLVLNMWDVAASRGITIDVDALQARLGVPVVKTEAHRRIGLDDVRRAVTSAIERGPIAAPRLFPAAFYDECDALGAKLRDGNGQPGGDGSGLKTATSAARNGGPCPPYLLERMLLDVGGTVESRFADAAHATLAADLIAARERLKDAGCRVPAVEARVRYAWARDVLHGVATQPTERPVTASDKLDKWLTHRFVGLLVFCLLMLVVFLSIFQWAGPFMDGIEAGQGWIADLVKSYLSPGPLRSLIVDGVIAGVGGVIVFLPQIVFLFLFIALLEDCGYMARAAFLMDRLMTRIGLSGKSFVPLMSSFACAIPGVMATRVIENRRDRMVTILVAPLMSCSARLPVYVLMISLFVPEEAKGTRGLVMFAMYSLGILVAIPVAWLLKKTFFKGETPPFVMELPSYKWPSPRIVAARVYDRAKAFVVRAGTLIFATSVLIWAAGYFPEDRAAIHQLEGRIEAWQAANEVGLKEIEDQVKALASWEAILLPAVDPDANDAARKAALDAAVAQGAISSPSLEKAERAHNHLVNLKESEQARADALHNELDSMVEELNQLNGRAIEASFLGKAGHFIEPAVRPLGWDWKIGVGAIASFPAREVIIATLGTIYSLGSDVDEENEGLRDTLRSEQWSDGRPVYTMPVAISIMVFFALCAQCAATLMVIRRETNSWFWPAFTFAYMTGLAYVGALVAYQATRLIVG